MGATEIKFINDKMPFGKFEGFTIRDIIDVDLNYFVWMAETTVFRFDVEAIEYAISQGAKLDKQIKTK